MPILPCPLTEYTTHIFDPLFQNMVNRLIYTMGYKDIFKDNIYINSSYARTSDTTDGDNNAMIRSDKFIADVTMQMQPDSTKWNTFNFNHTAAYGINSNSIKNNHLLFLDSGAKVSLWEQSSPCSVILNCRMVFLNKMHAYQTPHILLNRFLSGSVLEVADLFYDYQLPTSALYAFSEIHSRRGLDLDYYQYLRVGSDGQIGLVKNIHGDRPEYVVKKSQIRCLYTVEYSDEQPSDEKTNAAPNSFVIPFTYTIQFALPNLLFLEYPIMINNQLLPQECIPTHIYNTAPGFTGDFTFKTMSDYYHEYYKNQPTSCFISPFWEDWAPPSNAMPRRYSHEPFFIGTLTIDDPNEKMMIDLSGDLGDGFRFNPILLDILREQGEGAFKFESLFNISVYKDNQLLDRSELSLSDELQLSFSAKEPLAIYRLVISQMQYLFNLRIEYWDLAFKYRFFLGNANTIKEFFHKRVPYWKNYTQFYFDNRTKSYYDKTTKAFVFAVDKDGRMYRWIDGIYGSPKKEYFDDLTYLPEGVKKYGSFTTFRILDTDITTAGGTTPDTP